MCCLYGVQQYGKLYYSTTCIWRLSKLLVGLPVRSSHANSQYLGCYVCAVLLTPKLRAAHYCVLKLTVMHAALVSVRQEKLTGSSQGLLPLK